MNSIWFPITITFAYLYFILILGPRLMKNRKAFDINKVIIIYNIAQVIFNLYLFKLTTDYALRNIHSFRCFRVFNADTENGHLARVANWLFTLNKLMDLLDTIFFVMKKKQSHVSFLHVYHHVLTFTGCWAMSKYLPGGQLVVLGVLNSFVHCVMYSYYLLSLMDGFKEISSFIKKHITQMQIIQFLLAACHAVYGITDPTCDYPKSLLYFGLTQAFMLTALFLNFYRKAYLKKSHNKTDHQLQNGNGSLRNGLTKKMH